jgi:hypothetical protein
MKIRIVSESRIDNGNRLIAFELDNGICQERPLFIAVEEGLILSVDDSAF